MDITERLTASYAQTKYAQYKFSSLDTFTEIASRYNTTVKTLADINNITGNIPKYIKDVAKLAKQGVILVPLLGNGGSQSTPAYYYKYDAINLGAVTWYASSSSTLAGSGGAVSIIVNGAGYAIPCYPTSLSDSYSVSFNSSNMFTSTEPYFVFHNSGPRSVSVNFQFHREMRGIDNDGYIDSIISAVEAACYPVNDGWMGSEIILIVGAEIYIRGILGGNVGVSYSGPIIDGRHNVIDLSFSINEVTGENLSFAGKLGIR
jgi:LysM repeat protein